MGLGGEARLPIGLGVQMQRWRQHWPKAPSSGSTRPTIAAGESPLRLRGVR
jgi:hypothetical protein